MPARNEAMPKARSFWRRDVDPDGGARPLVGAHRQETAARGRPHEVAHGQRHEHEHASTRSPNWMRAMLVPSRTPRLIPKMLRVRDQVALQLGELGVAEDEALEGDAAASVTTASWAPRMRSAGIPTMTPKAAATRAETSAGEHGNGHAGVGRRASRARSRRCRRAPPWPARSGRRSR